MERSLFSGNINTGDKILKRQISTLPIMRGQPSRPPSGKVTRVSNLQISIIIRAHNRCHDNRQLIVLAINCNHSASKIIAINWD